MLDRLEYHCARDVAYAEGLAGELLRGGAGAGGSASASAGESEGESDAEDTYSAAVAEWLDAAGLSHQLPGTSSPTPPASTSPAATAARKRIAAR